MKKLLPILFFVMLAVITLIIKQYKEAPPVASETYSNIKASSQAPASKESSNSAGFDRTQELYFTKHAKCRMACRKITQTEVRQIQAEGKVNYNKSRLDDPKGPTYAIEGTTDDGQRVRIIFAPKQKHTSVVTVIDLENEYACPSC